LSGINLGVLELPATGSRSRSAIKPTHCRFTNEYALEIPIPRDLSKKIL